MPTKKIKADTEALAYTRPSFPLYCDRLRKSHPEIASIHNRGGYPPYWKRANNFESLCKTIIEQQVSLVSARSSYLRLRSYAEGMLPARLATMTRDEFRACGITKQKATYLQLLAQHLIQHPDFFHQLKQESHADVFSQLTALKGIGPWTAGVYMLVALNRLDVFPEQDVALLNSIGYELFDGRRPNQKEAQQVMQQYAPLRSIASCYFYQAYILKKKIHFVP